MKNRWSDAARAASAAARLSKYGPMMGLQPWGDEARAAAYAARAEREVMSRVAGAAGFGGTGGAGDSALRGLLAEAYDKPARSSGGVTISSSERVDQRMADYDRAFREWYKGLEKTSGNIAGFHALVAAAGGGVVGAGGAYRQASGVRPVVGASRAFGSAGKYFTGKSPVYDADGVLSGFAKVGGRPYGRAFNAPSRPSFKKAGSVSVPDKTGEVIDPATGSRVGRVRYSAEDAAKTPSGRPVKAGGDLAGGGGGEFKGRFYGDRASQVGAMEQYERDMTRAYEAGRDAAVRGEGSVKDGLKAAGYLEGSEVGAAFVDGWREGSGVRESGGLTEIVQAPAKIPGEPDSGPGTSKGTGADQMMRDATLAARVSAGVFVGRGSELLRSSRTSALAIASKSGENVRNIGENTYSVIPLGATFASADRKYAPGEAVAMIAGNTGTRLTGKAKETIKRLHDAGFEFVVGSMSGHTDSDAREFIESLGGKVTVYDWAGRAAPASGVKEAGLDYGARESVPAMDGGAYDAGVAAYREGLDLPDAAKEAGLAEGSGGYDAFRKGWLDAPGLSDDAAGVAVSSGDGGDVYDLDEKAYVAGLAAYETGLTVEQAASEMGVAAGTPAYADLEKGYYDGEGVAEGRGADYAVDEGEGLPASLSDDPATVAPPGTENPDAYVAGLADVMAGRPASPTMSGIEPGSVAEGDYLKGYLSPGSGESSEELPGYMEWADEVDAAFAADMAARGLDPQGHPLDPDPVREGFSRYMSDMDAAWDAEVSAMGLKRDGSGGGYVREAATAYGGDVSLSRQLLDAVSSKTAKDAARALGVLSGQWGANSDIVNQLPPDLLEEYEAGLKDGAKGYDYGIRPPVDRAGVIRRVNAVIAGMVGDDDDPVGGYWPDHLSPANQTAWAREANAGGPKKYGDDAAGLLRAAMDWLGTSLAENDRESVNAALSYMADTLAAIQEDGRDVVRMRRGESVEAEADGDGEEIDAEMPEFDEDGNEVGGESTFYEDSVADPNAVPPWDFERDPRGFFGAVRNRARRVVAEAAVSREKLENRWSDAARAASAAARLAKYGSMMGLQPWGDAARAAAALARGFSGGGASSGGSGGGGKGGKGGKKGGGRSGGGGVRGGGSRGRTGDGRTVSPDYAEAVESYGENGMDGMKHEERLAIFEEIREREEAGKKLTESDRKFLSELEAWLDEELKRKPAKKPDGGEWKAEQDPEQKPLGFFPLAAYDELIEAAEENGDRRKARKLRAEKNEARKAKARKELAEKRAKRRGSLGDLSYPDPYHNSALVRDTSKTVWDLRKPNDGWESRGGTPAKDGVFYTGDGKLYDKDGRVVGKAPKSPRDGAVFRYGRWFDARTGKAIKGGGANG